MEEMDNNRIQAGSERSSQGLPSVLWAVKDTLLHKVQCRTVSHSYVYKETSNRRAYRKNWVIISWLNLALMSNTRNAFLFQRKQQNSRIGIKLPKQTCFIVSQGFEGKRIIGSLSVTGIKHNFQRQRKS